MDNCPNVKVVMIRTDRRVPGGLAATPGAPGYPGFGHSDWPDSKKFAYTFRRAGYVILEGILAPISD